MHAMASLTIRKLEETIKAELRLRAARNGRSVEDEVRVILREAAQPNGAAAPPRAKGAPAPDRASHRYRAAHHPDHRRRDRRLQGAGPDPAAERTAVRRALRAHPS